MGNFTKETRPKFNLALTLVVISSIAVLLRFLARARTKAKYAADDWWILVALLLYYVYFGVGIWSAIKGGSFRANKGLTVPRLIVLLKAVYIVCLLSLLIITAVKISALCLYRRVFATSSFRRRTVIIGSLCLLWLLGSTIALILRCIPLPAAWDPRVQGKCSSLETVFIAAEAPNCVLDFVVVILPINMIRKLHLPLHKKILLAGIFALGGLVTIISIVRMVIALNFRTDTYQIITSAHLLTSQLCLAIVSACLPTYRPLIPKADSVSQSVKSFYASLLRSARSATASSLDYGNENSADNRIDRTCHAGSTSLDEKSVDEIHLTPVSRSTKAEDRRKDYSANQIIVTRSIEVV